MAKSKEIEGAENNANLSIIKLALEELNKSAKTGQWLSDIEKKLADKKIRLIYIVVGAASSNYVIIAEMELSNPKSDVIVELENQDLILNSIELDDFFNKEKGDLSQYLNSSSFNPSIDLNARLVTAHDILSKFIKVFTQYLNSDSNSPPIDVSTKIVSITPVRFPKYRLMKFDIPFGEEPELSTQNDYVFWDHLTSHRIESIKRNFNKINTVEFVDYGNLNLDFFKSPIELEESLQPAVSDKPVEEWTKTFTYPAKIAKVAEDAIYCDLLINEETKDFSLRTFDPELFAHLEKPLDNKFVSITIRSKPGASRIDVFDGQGLVNKELFDLKDAWEGLRGQGLDDPLFE